METRVHHELNGQVEQELGKILPTFNEQSFCEHIISKVQIALTYRDDMDKIKMQWKEASVTMTDCHSKVGAEELARKWNVGLQTAQDTLRATTQMGIQTAVHPMTKCL